MMELRTVCKKTIFVKGIFGLGMLIISSFGCSQVKNDSANLQANSGSGNSAPSPVSSNDTRAATTPGTSSDIYDVTYENGQVFPKNPEMQQIAKRTTAELASAFITGDFSKVYANLDPEFQKGASQSDLKEVYEQRKDPNLTDAVLTKLETGEPDIGKLSGVTTTVNVKTGEKSEYVLRIEGKYDVAPQPVTFKYDFVARSGKWRTKALVLGKLNR